MSTADLLLQITVTESEAASQPPAAAPSATDADSSSPVRTASAHAAEQPTVALGAPVAAPHPSSAGSGAAQHAEPAVAAHGERGGQESDAGGRSAAGLAGASNALLVAALADGLEREMLLVVRRVQDSRLSARLHPRSVCCLRIACRPCLATYVRARSEMTKAD